MKEIFGLTRADRDLLDELHRRFGTLRENAPSARLPIDITDEPPQAPEVYIALVPSGGIPACEGVTGTGGPSFLAGDVPGYADCGIYRLVNGVIYYTRQTKKVYNLSGDVITQQWITVKRDKFGQWFADTGGGGNTNCETRNEVWMIAMSTGIEGGTFSVTFEVNSVEDTVIVPADSTAAEVKTAFADHSQLAESDLNTSGGPLPGSAVKVEFIGTQAGTPIPLTSFSGSDLSNLPGTGSPATEGGLLVVLIRWTPGFSAV